MRSANRLITSALFVACLIGSFTSCKRISSSNNRPEQASVPAGGLAGGSASGSPTPAACSIPFNGNFVNDTADVLNGEAEAKLEHKLDTLKSVGKIDFAVVTIKTTGEQEIAAYSLALARCWSLGESNPDGAAMLLTLAVDDRKWRLEVSRRMEKVLSNEEMQEAGRQMTPHARESNFYEGIDAFVNQTIKTIAPRRQFSMPSS